MLQCAPSLLWDAAGVNTSPPVICSAPVTLGGCAIPPLPTGFSTRAIHAGQAPDPTTGAVVPPIYATSTYAQDGVGGLRAGYEYSRSANPTRTALEECLAALEGGTRGFAFASGLAAEDTLLRTIARPGAHLVVPNDAYGGSSGSSPARTRSGDCGSPRCR